MSGISELNGQHQLRATMAVAALRAQGIGTPAPASPAATVGQPDAVSISDAARSLASARQTVDAASDVREDRVSSIKAAIAAGTYSIDSRSLASSLLRSGALDG
jgi:flagellar biosynthesis anti-sigma factor FlgM